MRVESGEGGGVKRHIKVLVWLLVSAAVINLWLPEGARLPMWAGTLVIAGGVAWIVVFDTRLPRRLRNRLDYRSRRMKQGRCPECGYDLRGEFTRPCSECGWVMPVYRAGTRDS